MSYIIYSFLLFHNYYDISLDKKKQNLPGENVSERRERRVQPGEWGRHGLSIRQDQLDLATATRRTRGTHGGRQH